MADNLLGAPPSEERSAIMRAVPRKDSKPEIVVRRVLHQLGYRFRLHRRDLPGTPDVVLPRLRIAVFVHGCFWHRHGGCRHASTPKTRAEFWQAKFERNVERDAEVTRALNALGWSVLAIWECETSDRDRLIQSLSDTLTHLPIDAVVAKIGIADAK